MYYVYGNSSWYIDCCPLYSRCPLLRVSVIGVSTVIGFGEHKLVLPALMCQTLQGLFISSCQIRTNHREIGLFDRP